MIFVLLPGMRQHLDAVTAFRAASKKKSTREAARTPALFIENRQPDVPYLCIPSVVSESRHYWTVAKFQPEVVASNLVFVAPDNDGLLFALLSSSMFITWQRAVGGRMKFRPTFSNTLTGILSQFLNSTRDSGDALFNQERRSSTHEMSVPINLWLIVYDPYLMGGFKRFQKAHDALDAEVDRAFGASRRLTSDKQRLELLFPAYQKLAEGK